MTRLLYAELRQHLLAPSFKKIKHERETPHQFLRDNIFKVFFNTISLAIATRQAEDKGDEDDELDEDINENEEDEEDNEDIEEYDDDGEDEEEDGASNMFYLTCI